MAEVQNGVLKTSPKVEDTGFSETTLVRVILLGEGLAEKGSRLVREPLIETVFRESNQSLRSCCFLSYEEIHYIQHRIKIFDVLAALYPVLTVDNHAGCARDTEKLYITLAFT